MAKAKVTRVKAGESATAEKASKTAAAKTTVRRSTTRKRLALREELVLGVLLAELVGSFVLTAVALTVNNSFVVVAFAMMFLIMVLGRLSGGHINPVVTVALLVARKISALKAAGYIVAQVLGAMLALVVVTQFISSTPVDVTTGQKPAVFEIAALSGEWRPFFAEMLGGLILAFGAMAAFTGGRRETHERGFMVGGALFLALVVALLGSAAVVNPAEAFGLNAYKLENLWSLWAYAAGPLVGAVAGAWLYRLMQWDMSGGKEES